MIHAELLNGASNLEVKERINLLSPQIYSRLDKGGRLLTVEKASNHLKITNLKTKKIEKRYPGNEEEPYSKCFKA
jgi:hypothetical protein